MAAEFELDPKHKVLPFKVRAASKEAQPHKAAHVLDPDPKNHWSTSTNAKEWLLLELEEPCLLQQIRIHNKSVLEWEISVGLRYKPDLFYKVRTRCEASRRESQYLANYTACRYVRLSCLRGNPIALYSVQLIGISMPGLEPEFQPLVDHLLPFVTSSKQAFQDLYIQLLGEIMTRLSPFITYLEGDLSSYSENTESSLRFLAMLSGPLYPILVSIDERERLKNLVPVSDTESSKGAQSSLFTVSSNFQAPPRRSRSPAPSHQPAGQLVAFRPDVVLLLLRVAYRDSSMNMISRMVSKVFGKLSSTISSVGAYSDLSPRLSQGASGGDNMAANVDSSTSNMQQIDYAAILGDEFHVAEDDKDESGVSALLDISSVEEALLHFLYASASKPILRRRLAEMKPDLMPILPFLQAILPAMRPTSIGPSEQVDENFVPWQTPLVQRAFAQVVSLATTMSYQPLLDACAGYLCSFSVAHEKAACIIIDLCSGPLAPWLPVVIAKVELAFELVEGILNAFQVVDKGIDFARAALVYVILGLSGHMDEYMTMYKAVKHSVLFIMEILEPFLLPAITPIKNTIAFGDVSTVITDKQEHYCTLALAILRAAIKKPEIISALEIEWRRGIVKPSVLISVIAPHLPFPAGLDDAFKGLSESQGESTVNLRVSNVTDGCSTRSVTDSILKPLNVDDDGVPKLDLLSSDSHEEHGGFFISGELKLLSWRMLSSSPQDTQEFGCFGVKGESKAGGCDFRDTENSNLKDTMSLHSDYVLLSNYQERELRASELVHFAEELHLQVSGSVANHEAAVECLLLAAECHLNPWTPQSAQYDLFRKSATAITKDKISDQDNQAAAKSIRVLEEERDKIVLKILIKAAELDAQIANKSYEDLQELKVANFDDKLPINNSSIDAITLLRNHQSILLRFFIVNLRRGDRMYEALLQGLLFLLSAATDLVCSGEHIVDVILKAAGHVNLCLLREFEQKDSNHVTGFSLCAIQRQWLLLCRLVVAASQGHSIDNGSQLFNGSNIHQKGLISPSAWMNKLPEFALSPLPLVRYIGWEALSHFAECQQQTGVVLASDLEELSGLLSVFADDLMCSVISAKPRSTKHPPESLERKLFGFNTISLEMCSMESKNSLYPEIDVLTLNLQRQFAQNALKILDAVCSQLRGIPGTALPDILSWFSELCRHPFILEQGPEFKLETKMKGFAAANVRFIILRVMEVLLLEHMEALVPELPRMINVVLSLCQSSYCDIFLLESVLNALKPIVSYGIRFSASAELYMEEEHNTMTIESLCFDPLIRLLQRVPKSEDGLVEQNSNGPFLVFLAGAVLSVLSSSRALEILNLLKNWADFSVFSSGSSYVNYLHAFQKVFEACGSILKKTVLEKGLPIQETVVQPQDSILSDVDENCKQEKYMLNEDHGLASKDGSSLESICLSKPEEFEECIKDLSFTLGVSLEKVWRFHPQLSDRLTNKLAFCIMLCANITKLTKSFPLPFQNDIQAAADEKASVVEGEQESLHCYTFSLESICQTVLALQKSECWQVANCTMEFLLAQPDSKAVVAILPQLCCVLENQCSHAPRISWRGFSVNWLSKILQRVNFYQVCTTYAPLKQLFKVLIDHKEPEQRIGVLQELIKLTDFQETEKHLLEASSCLDVLQSKQETWNHEHKPVLNTDFLVEIVDAEWDGICSLAAYDPFPGIRKLAIEVLIKFIPLAQMHHLQRLLSSLDTFLPGLAKDAYTMIDAPMTRLSLSLLCCVCLYSGTKEISTIPSRVWTSLELLSKQRNGSALRETERQACLALLQLRNDEDDAKKLIRGFLHKVTEQQADTNNQFLPVQEAVLQVLARLNVARMIEDKLLCESVQQIQELEEAEIELELLKKETVLNLHGGQEELQRQMKIGLKDKHEEWQNETMVKAELLHKADSKRRKERLEQLRNQIVTEENLAIKQEIAARLERQRLARYNRQQALERATLREIELVEELEREKNAEIEREIERQILLEKERARTKELRHSLELETERHTQRDLQRELEQRESGRIRQSRREFSGSGGGSRPRERYREREGGRSSQDVRSSIVVARENSTTPPATPTAAF
ncbi:hypothetical protein KP509_02G008200 [Ceratopteris richardii]|uniref:DNA-repair protein Xrcc1 N-terminal domain-containing protein n=1 Tax=Ceratopteris richardii TaxID=49495 RepID=A0A8T2VBB3_CERRI|nr:hypothetical protein KP509_02G008200 [Ceratopteris richardii]